MEEDAEESVLHGEAMSSKTAVTLEAKTRFLPYIALGSGVSQCCWGKVVETISFGAEAGWVAALSPSFFGRESTILDRQSAVGSEATYWLRDFLSPRFAGSDLLMLGSHSCKCNDF